MTALRIAGTIGESIVDGPGIRYVLFTQGCPHGCPGCHNPQTHDFAGGKEMTTDEIIAELRDYDMPTASRSDLISILRTADMVKFAKAEPEAEENEDNLSRALYFVENTKLVDAERNEGKQDINIKTNIED